MTITYKCDRCGRDIFADPETPMGSPRVAEVPEVRVIWQASDSHLCDECSGRVTDAITRALAHE